jgi:hypothetical protein
LTGNNLYKLQKKDVDRAVDVLARAFYDYPMFKHILGEKHIKEL